jgi:hypothetical protein
VDEVLGEGKRREACKSRFGDAVGIDGEGWNKSLLGDSSGSENKDSPQLTKGSHGLKLGREAKLLATSALAAPSRQLNGSD